MMDSEKMEEKKSPFSSWNDVIKYAIYLVCAVAAYTTMSAKTDNNTEVLKEIKKEMKEQSDKWDIEKRELNARLGAIEITIAIEKQKLKDRDNVE